MQRPLVGDRHEQGEDRRGEGEVAGGEAECEEPQDGSGEGVGDGGKDAGMRPLSQ